MEPAELRIGNWVNAPHGNVQIERWVNDGAHFTDGCGGTFLSLQPIKLTEEWLNKFGFKVCKSPFSDVKAWVIGEDAERLIWCSGHLYKPLPDGFIKLTDTNHYKGVQPCELVNQLQNIYHALKGEELQTK